MPPRRPHMKSRNGCEKCKKRRVKCDEVHPSCGNCIKHGVECTFSLAKRAGPVINTSPRNRLSPFAATVNLNEATICQPQNHHHHIHLHSSTLEYTNDLTGNGLHLPSQHTCTYQPQQFQYAFPPSNPSSHSTSLNLGDLELFHHFSTSTYSTLSTKEDLAQLWKIAIPKLAFSHPFLLHAILAVAGMHLANLEKGANKSRVLLATKHYDRAAVGILEAARNPDSSNCSALFVSCSLVVVHCLAGIPYVEKGSGVGWIRGTPARSREWPHLVGAVNKVLERYWIWVHNGVAGPMLRVRLRPRRPPEPERWDKSSSRLSSFPSNSPVILGPTGINPLNITRGIIDGPQTSFAAPDLFQLVNPHFNSAPQKAELEDSSVISTYSDVVRSLKLCVDEYDEVESVVPGMSTLPSSDRFLEFVREERPRALVIVAYYNIMMMRARKLWWIEKKPGDVVEVIAKVVGEEWSWWMEWPRAQVRLQMLELT